MRPYAAGLDSVSAPPRPKGKKVLCDVGIRCVDNGFIVRASYKSVAAKDGASSPMWQEDDEEVYETADAAKAAIADKLANMSVDMD